VDPYIALRELLEGCKIDDRERAREAVAELTKWIDGDGALPEAQYVVAWLYTSGFCNRHELVGPTDAHTGDAFGMKEDVRRRIDEWIENNP
jgi:hypothetical protein